MAHKGPQIYKKVGFIGFSSSVKQKLHDALIEQVQFETVLAVQTGIKTTNDSQDSNAIYGLEQFRAGRLQGLERPCELLYQQLLTYLSVDLHRILGIMIRQGFNSYSFSYEEMMVLYYKLVENSLSLLEKTKPDLIIFRSVPHFAADFLLFQIAKHLKIRAITLETVEAFDAVYLIDDIDEKTPIITGVYNDPIFDEKAAELISSARKMLSFKPDYYVDVSKQRQFNQSLIGLTAWTSYEFAKGVAGFLIGKKMLRAAKQSGFSTTSEVSYFDVFKEKLSARLKTLSLRNTYELLASPKPDSPYFLFIANYQPERTTLPDAGNHWHFEQTITDISRAMPNGVTLLVREHPTIFNLPGRVHYRGSLHRSKQAYENIAKLPNVTIASCTTDIGPLIKSCVGVISLTGTVAYQANMAGKPALLFGSRWFSKSKSIHRYQNSESLQIFFETALYDGKSESLQHWRSLFEELKSALIPVPDIINVDAFDETSAAYVKSLAALIMNGDDNEQL